jgi:TPP-dependent pyruvate/acetoin dehydrogenase alpha subunit
MKKWKELLETFKSPIERMEKYLTRRGLITPERTAKVRNEAKNLVRDALKNATGEVHHEVDSLFEDVYEKMP